MAWAHGPSCQSRSSILAVDHPHAPHLVTTTSLGLPPLAHSGTSPCLPGPRPCLPCRHAPCRHAPILPCVRLLCPPVLPLLPCRPPARLPVHSPAGPWAPLPPPGRQRMREKGGRPRGTGAAETEEDCPVKPTGTGTHAVLTPVARRPRRRGWSIEAEHDKPEQKAQMEQTESTQHHPRSIKPAHHAKNQPASKPKKPANQPNPAQSSHSCLAVVSASEAQLDPELASFPFSLLHLPRTGNQLSSGTTLLESSTAVLPVGLVS